MLEVTCDGLGRTALLHGMCGTVPSVLAIMYHPIERAQLVKFM